MSHWENMGKTDEWYTPKYIFDAMGCRFDTDVASPVDRSHVFTPADHFITNDSLNVVWRGFVWMNPPFGGRNGLTPWLEKIWMHGDGIALTPDRTSAEWWQTSARRSDAILFISGKVKFLKSDGSTGLQPSNGTTLFAFGENAVNALKNASSVLGALLINYSK